MSDFNEAVEFVLINEGGLFENANDMGGITNFGISLRFLRSLTDEKLRKYGFFGGVNEDSVRNMTADQAKAIYFGEFWEVNRLSEFRDQIITNYVFDMVVNMGAGQAIKLLQRACWAATYNKGCIKDDGIIGEMTISLANSIGRELIAIMMAARAEFYRGLDKPVFLNGWLNRTYRI